jgi:uncharacterized protein
MKIMALFVIRALDKPDSLSLRMSTRAAHLDHARSIDEALFAAGPLLDAIGENPIGSLIIVDMATREDVADFAAKDPYATAGLFASVEITPWRRALP